MTSSVIALLVLAISIAFFYEYLKVVYTIHQVVPAP
jgi:hypothetical protein